MSRESRFRSLLKAITWRLIASGTTFLLAFWIFSETGCADVLEKSGIVAGLEMITKLALYYGHERLWQMAPRGSVRKIIEPTTSHQLKQKDIPS